MNESLTRAIMTAAERETGEEKSDEEKSDEEEFGDDYRIIIPILPPGQNLK